MGVLTFEPADLAQPFPWLATDAPAPQAPNAGASKLAASGSVIPDCARQTGSGLFFCPPPPVIADDFIAPQISDVGDFLHQIGGGLR